MQKKNFRNNIALRQGGPHIDRTQSQDGEVIITEHSVFPGIWLAIKEVSAFSFQNIAGYPDGLWEITHCREGRLEFEEENRFFFLGSGDMSIHHSSGNRAVLRCPTGYYRGLSVIVDPEIPLQCTSPFWEDVNVDLAALHQKFCSKNSFFLLRSTPKLEHIFSELYDVPEAIRNGYFKVKVLELLLFLSCLDPTLSPQKQHVCSQGQLSLVKQIFAFLREHRNQRLTAEQLAAEFHVSQEQLRRSVQNVYGKPLYQCIRGYKMHLAAARLLESNRTIMDIASEFGYDNSSKFARAFRDVLGISPADYRLHSGQKEPPSPPFGAKVE